MAKFTPATLLGQFADTNVINTNFQALADIINNAMLSRDNAGLVEPNQLESNQDINGKTLYNLPAGTENSHAVNLGQLLEIVGFTPYVGTLVQTDTATAAQTAFPITIGEYTPGANNLAMYVNGVREQEGIDYLESSSTLITRTAGSNEGDSVLFVLNERTSDVSTTPASSVTVTVASVLTNVSAYLNSNLPTSLQPTNLAGLPAASLHPGITVTVSDASTGYTVCVSNNVNWIDMQTGVTVI